MKTDRFTYPDGRVLGYPAMFDVVQQYVSVERPDAAHTLADLPDVIQRYLINQRVEVNRPLPAVSGDIAQDMAGASSILSKYLDHLADYPTLEGININSWDSIVLKYTDKPDEWLEETFLSPRHAFNILNRLVSRSRTGLLNEATPGAISYIIDGVRNTVLCSPIVPKDVGVYASIRIVRPQSVSGEKLLTEKEL